MRIKVIYKKEVGNYRPVCTLPPLYNCSQHSYTTDSIPDLTGWNQRDQGGCRRSYQTLDHLATYRLLEQKCQEWGSIKMWVATVDFMNGI